MNSKKPHPMEHLIPAYVNDQMDADSKTEFCKAVSGDAELQALLTLHRKIQNTVQKDDAPINVNPSFESIRDRVERSQANSWNPLKWLIAPAAALMVLFIVQFPEEPSSNEYQTLTDPTQVGQEFVRIVVSDPELLDNIISDHGLVILRRYENAATIDVELQGESAAVFTKQIQTDDRVTLARVIDTR